MIKGAILLIGIAIATLATGYYLTEDSTSSDTIITGFATKDVETPVESNPQDSNLITGNTIREIEDSERSPQQNTAIPPGKKFNVSVQVVG